MVLLFLSNTFFHAPQHYAPDPKRKPNLRELADLTSPTGLLPATLVPLLPLKQLKCRAAEIETTHPQYRDELPLVLAYEMNRQQRFTGGLVASVNLVKVA